MIILTIVAIFVLTGVLANFVVSSSQIPTFHVAQDLQLPQEIVAGIEDDRLVLEKNMYVTATSRTVIQEDAKKDVTIIFGGDMMFDRYIRQMSVDKGYDHILADVSEKLNTADLVVANLEGPVTNNESQSLHSEIGSYDNYIFTFDPVVLETLKKNKMTLVNIGNNHMSNFGTQGVTDTKRFIKEAGLNYFGDTGTTGEQRYYVKEINGQTIAFVNYNAFVPKAMENAMEDITTVTDAADHIILYTHWGEEYVTHSREDEQIVAHQFIDAGVDLIIGSHPHVVQESEVYNGRTIYYSLGNFVFDQYFSDETRNGLLVEVHLPAEETGSLLFEEISISLKTTGQTYLNK